MPEAGHKEKCCLGWQVTCVIPSGVSEGKAQDANENLSCQTQSEFNRDYGL